MVKWWSITFNENIVFGRIIFVCNRVGREGSVPPISSEASGGAAGRGWGGGSASEAGADIR